MKSKASLILMFIPIGIFAFMVVKDRFSNKNIELLKEDYLHINITNVEKFKSAVVLNDTIAIFKGTYRVFPIGNTHYNKNYYQYLESIKEPYNLFKKGGSDTLTIIKRKDTLFYKLVPF